ncbi:MAG: AAA family ATPase [Anaerolineae bacterium]|nr:AAA family ATPase [Anaerolineae bacterium]
MSGSPQAQVKSPQQQPPAQPGAPAQPPPQPRVPRGASQRRVGGPTPRSLSQVLKEADRMVVQGELDEYLPIPSGFDQIDRLIGGGLRRTELVLLGGPQGIGKTITALQMARNLAFNEATYALYVSYEHSEIHLLNRLICQESIDPTGTDTSSGIRLKDLHNIVVSKRAREWVRNEGNVGLHQILSQHPKTAKAMETINRYADRLLLMKASPATTTLNSIREITRQISEATQGKLVLFIDYLQKVAIYPERAADENDKVTIIVEGLKDIAMTHNIPVLAIVAADREGLRSRRMHLYHLRGSSALDYECDIAILMNNKFHILSKDHVSFNPYKSESYRDWVVFTLEKNRAGRAMIDVEFQLRAQHFCFNPKGNLVEQKLIDEKIIVE